MQINQQNNLPPLWLALHKYINYLRFYKCIYYFFPRQLKTVFVLLYNTCAYKRNVAKKLDAKWNSAE